MISFAQLSTSAQDIFTMLTQELLVVLVFFISLALWKHVGKRSKPVKAQKVVSGPNDTNLIKPPQKMVVTEIQPPVDRKVDQVIKAAEIQMMKLLEQRQFTRALNFYRTFERDGRDRFFSEALLSSFVQSAIRVGKIDIVERILRSMSRRGEQPSCEFWQTTFKMLSSRKHFDCCLIVYNMFGSSLPPDKVVFSCLINAALESSAPERAASMLDRYRESGIDPREYVLLFRTYVAVNDGPSAEATFRELGENMTSLMLNLVLLISINAKDPERALELLHEARTFQERRDSRLGHGGQREPIVDVVSYNTLIKGFAQAGKMKKCFDCFHEMRTHGLVPDDVTFGTLLDMCITDNDMKSANEVIDLLVNGDRPVDTVMCTLFIKGLVRAHQLPKAIELYDEMKRRSSKGMAGAQPDLVTYSVLIKAFVDSHDLEKALLLVEDMKLAGHAPDDIILTHLLEGCRYIGNHALGKRLFEDMLAAGVKPSEYTLITMLKLHGRCGAHDEAHELVKNWEKQHGMKPSVIHYTCLMSGCLRTKNYEQAWQAYQLMGQHGTVPDETTLATVLPGMVASHQWDRVLAIIRRALKATPMINIAHETLNNALAQIRQGSGSNIYADQLEQMMKEAGISVSIRNARR
jgi:pentatricopeptide repeat protein